MPVSEEKIKSKRNGFTLLEVMAAVAIMGISSAGVLLSINKGLDTQKRYADIMIMNDLTVIDRAVSVYRRLYGVPPQKIEDLSRARILAGDYSGYEIIFTDGAIVPVKHIDGRDMSLDDYIDRHKKNQARSDRPDCGDNLKRHYADGVYGNPA